MNKPTSFYLLPHDLQESLLWDMDLYYDPYESSMTQVVADILNGNACHRNQLVVGNYFKALDTKTLLDRAINVEQNIAFRQAHLQRFIKEMNQ